MNMIEQLEKEIGTLDCDQSFAALMLQKHAELTNERRRRHKEKKVCMGE